MSRGIQPNAQGRSSPVADDAMCSNPSSKTPLFIGSGGGSSCENGQSDSRSLSILPESTKSNSGLFASARCKHIPLISCAVLCHVRVVHSSRTDRRRVGSRGIGKPHRPQPVESTCWLKDELDVYVSLLVLLVAFAVAVGGWKDGP
jgi:hypothetical protein